MKTYLITGGAGFIGSNFVRYLLNKEPHLHVKVIDNLSYSSNLQNLAAFKDLDNFEFIKGDICDSALVNRIVQGVDVIVNFAAEVSVDRSLEDKSSFIRTDIMGVQVLLEAVLVQQVPLKRFVQISTDEVYGSIDKGSFTETSLPAPRNPYAASKLGGESLAYSYFASYGLPIVISRASNNYGPWAYPEKVIPLFITNLHDGLQVPVFGKGTQVRDWLHVMDHCSAIDLLIEKGINGERYNIGADQTCTNIDLTCKLLTLMGKDDSYIKYVNDRPGHDQRYSIDSSKIKQLGWNPAYNLEGGLAETVAWYLENVSYWRDAKDGLDSRYAKGLWGE